jgi:hypothetical protein
LPNDADPQRFAAGTARRSPAPVELRRALAIIERVIATDVDNARLATTA